MPAATKHTQIVSAKKRNKSHLENHNSKCVTNPYNKNRPHNVAINVPRGSNYGKTCELCRGKGHNRSKCERVLKDYQRHPLPLHDSKLRNNLVMSLVTDSLNGYPLLHRNLEDTRTIIDKFKKNQVYCYT